MRWLTPLHEATGVDLGIRALAGASPNGHELLTQGQSYTMAVVGAEERTVMASATTVSRSTGAAVGPTVATALWSTTSAGVPFIAVALVKITYDLTLWCPFRRMKPPEEAMLRPAPRR